MQAHVQFERHERVDAPLLVKGPAEGCDAALRSLRISLAGANEQIDAVQHALIARQQNALLSSRSRRFSRVAWCHRCRRDLARGFLASDHDSQHPAWRSSQGEHGQDRAAVLPGSSQRVRPVSIALRRWLKVSKLRLGQSRTCKCVNAPARRCNCQPLSAYRARPNPDKALYPLGRIAIARTLLWQ